VETGKQTGRGNKKVLPNSAKPLDTRKEIAKAANVGSNTVTRVEKIIAKAPAPVLEKLRKGETSINEAYTAIRYAEKEAAREERREENRAIIQKAVRTRAHKGFPPVELSLVECIP
jgi:transcriptional regulator with XRE-family HTH domain